MVDLEKHQVLLGPTNYEQRERAFGVFISAEKRFSYRPYS